MKTTFISLALALLSITACAQKAPKTIKLLEPTFDKGLTLMEALKERKSSSGFTDRPIPLQDLSNIIWAALGVNRPDGRRTAPTGSNRQEIELYAFFEDGVYWYNYKAHTLDLVCEGDANTVSYVNVGYVSQNVYLACANAGIGSRARGGWDQAKVSSTLGLDPSMIVVLGQTVGYCE